MKRLVLSIGMPLGSIGPTLARARQKMKLHAEEQKRSERLLDSPVTEVELG